MGDDVLRLVLIACHPVLSREARVALTLRLVAGLFRKEVAVTVDRAADGAGPRR